MKPANDCQLGNFKDCQASYPCVSHGSTLATTTVMTSRRRCVTEMNTPIRPWPSLAAKFGCCYMVGCNQRVQVLVSRVKPMNSDGAAASVDVEYRLRPRWLPCGIHSLFPLNPLALSHQLYLQTYTQSDKQPCRGKVNIQASPSYR